MDPFRANLYFSTEGDIERVRLDGMNRQAIATGGSMISGLAIDLVEQKLYWSDSALKIIEMADLDGQGRKNLVAHLRSPASVAIMGRYV